MPKMAADFTERDAILLAEKSDSVAHLDRSAVDLHGFGRRGRFPVAKVKHFLQSTRKFWRCRARLQKVRSLKSNVLKIPQVKTRDLLKYAMLP